MADCMMFPNDWEKFLEDYSFRDREEVYTNGARLIPAFRVEQMMEHYLQKATEDAVPVVHGRWIRQQWGEEDYEHFCVCSECGERRCFETNYCSNCGAKMDLEV